MEQNAEAEWSADQVRALLERSLDERDRRYEQRFEGQEKAVAAALAAQEKATAAALAAAEKAVAKAEGAAERRFDSVNEFRAQQTELITTFMPRAEAEVQFKTLREKIEGLTGSTAIGAKNLYGYLIAGAGVITAVIAICLTIFLK